MPAPSLCTKVAPEKIKAALLLATTVSGLNIRFILFYLILFTFSEFETNVFAIHADMLNYYIFEVVPQFIFFRAVNANMHDLYEVTNFYIHI